MRARPALLLALGIAGGCGRGPLLEPGGSAAGVSGAAGAPAPDGAAGASDVGNPPMPPDRPCTPGQDQTCNDDPRVSSLWGSCQLSGQCGCFDGRSVNPATGRCRLGDACTASAHDPWPVSLAFDTSDCAQRPATECAPTVNASRDPANVIVGLAISMCHFPFDQLLRVELVSGCPTVLQTGYGPTQGAQGGGAEVVACLRTLFSRLRLACSSGADCVLGAIPSGLIP